MRFYALLLICIVAVCCAADESQKSPGFFDRLKNKLGSWSDNLPWNRWKKRAQIIAEDTKDLAVKTIESCKTETGVSDEAISAFRNGDFLKKNVDEKSKRFIKCYLDGLNMTLFGRIQFNVSVDRMGAIYGHKKAYATIYKCDTVGGIAGNNDLEKTLTIYTCFFNDNLIALL